MKISNKIWTFFASVKLTVVLLLSIAASSIIGTVIPQNRSPEEYLRAFGTFFYRIFEVFDIFDMYHSWWFQLLLVMLTVNIVVCSVERLAATWAIIFANPPTFRMSRFKGNDEQQAFSDPRPPAQALADCSRVIRAHFGYVQTEPSDDGGGRVLAEKWRWTRLGVYIVHASVVLLLLGGLIGSIFGFDGYVNIPEGEAVDHIRLRNTNRALALDFAIRCDDFNVSFYASGQPKEYRSRLSLVKDGRVLVQKDIIVNDPLRYQGINIFQSSYGKLAPEHAAAHNPPPKQITLSITSTASGMAYEKTLDFGQSIQLPEGGGSFVYSGYEPSATFMGQHIGAAVKGVVTPAAGTAVNVLLPLHFPNFDKMRRGAFILSVAGHKAEKFHPDAGPQQQARYYTGLQVTRDPGVWVVYAGFLGMIIGCLITFFMTHQQICVAVVAHERGSRITVAGLSDRNRFAMERKTDAIVRKLKRK